MHGHATEFSLLSASLAVDRRRDWDFLGGDADASDPLDYEFTGLNPSHGTNTGQLFADVGSGQGTSFGVANVAGLADLWLAFHGHGSLVQRYQGQVFLQDVFKRLFQETARRPPGWDQPNFRLGIADAEALLRAEPPTPASFALGPPADRLRLTPAST